MTHIILLTETWFKSEEQAMKHQLHNYTHYFSYRTDKTGGGVSAYIHNDLKHNLIESTYSGGNNYLWVRLEKVSMDIGVVYYPGDTNFQEFTSTLESQIDQRKRAILFGDFNIDLLEKSTHKRRQTYTNILNAAGYKILNKITRKYYTRKSDTKLSTLDHVSTSMKKDQFHFSLVESSMSDHRQIHLSLKKFKPPFKQRFTYRALNYEKLHQMASTLPLNQISNYTILENRLKELVDQSKVTKTKILNRPQDDWIHKNIIDGINQRNKLWAEMQKDSQNKYLEDKFKKKRDDVANLIRNTKDSYYYAKFSNCAKNPKKMWELIDYLSINKIKTKTAIPKLIIENRTITDSTQICNALNHFFSTIGALLASEILPHSNNALPNTLPQPHIPSKLSVFEQTTIDEVSKIIDNLDHNSSTGLDGLSTKAIKCIKTFISEALTNCINNLFSEGLFPQTLKTAKVSPIHKSGSKTDPGNYRPISVLPVLSKIIEKILHKRLETYLNSINYISDRQFGFRPKSNTLAATADLITKVKKNIDKKNIVLGVFIDLKKAFDTVSHDLLLMKLKAIGVEGQAFKMFKSYLTDRQQIVKMTTHQSNALPVSFGVPQGSILAPLLFSLYINDIQEIGLHGHLTLYADDTCLFYFGTSISHIISLAQSDLNNLFKWLQCNLLTINISKTSYIIFKAKNKIIPPYQSLTINNIPIKEQSSEKYLGLNVDNRLSWRIHIDHIKKKLSSLIGSLRNVVRCLPRKVRMTIYNSLIKSHLIYLIEIWGTAVKTKLSELQIIQNKLVKMLFHYPYLTPTTSIYAETNIMTIKQLYIYHTCILIRKIVNNTIHTSIALTQVKHTTTRSSRRASFLVLPKVRTQSGKNMLTYEGVQLYNRLPTDIKKSESLETFKKKLAHYVKEHFFL